MIHFLYTTEITLQVEEITNNKYSREIQSYKKKLPKMYGLVYRKQYTIVFRKCTVTIGYLFSILTIQKLYKYSQAIVTIKYTMNKVNLRNPHMGRL